jgi:ParB family chromosome partitioning protein
VRGWVSQGRLSVGHAKVILSLDSKEEQALAAQRVLKDGLTVRQTEKLVESLKPNRTPAAGASKSAKPKVSEAAWTDLEKRLQRTLGTRVRLSGTAEVGKVEIQYFTAGEFERLLKTLGLAEF